MHSDGRERPVVEGHGLDVALDGLLLGQPLAYEREVARVHVDPDAAGRQRCQVQTGTAARVEHGRLGVVPGQQAADDPATVAVEERLRAAQVIGHVDPVVRLDVAVVVADPLRPLGLGGEVGARPSGGGVIVAVHGVSLAVPTIAGPVNRESARDPIARP